jgi:hypothetical protein
LVRPSAGISPVRIGAVMIGAAVCATASCSGTTGGHLSARNVDPRHLHLSVPCQTIDGAVALWSAQARNGLAAQQRLLTASRALIRASSAAAASAKRTSLTVDIARLRGVNKRLARSSALTPANRALLKRSVGQLVSDCANSG